MKIDRSGVIFTVEYDPEHKIYRRDYPMALRNTRMTNGDWVGLLQEADHIVNRKKSHKKAYILIALVVAIVIFWLGVSKITAGIILIAIKREKTFIAIVVILEFIGYNFLVLSLITIMLVTTVPLMQQSMYMQKRNNELHDLVSTKSRRFLGDSRYFIRMEKYSKMPSICLFDRLQATTVVPDDIVHYVSNVEHQPERSSPLVHPYPSKMPSAPIEDDTDSQHEKH